MLPGPSQILVDSVDVLFERLGLFGVLFVEALVGVIHLVDSLLQEKAGVGFGLRLGNHRLGRLLMVRLLGLLALFGLLDLLLRLLLHLLLLLGQSQFFCLSFLSF